MNKNYVIIDSKYRLINIISSILFILISIFFLIIWILKMNIVTFILSVLFILISLYNIFQLKYLFLLYEIDEMGVSIGFHSHTQRYLIKWEEIIKIEKYKFELYYTTTSSLKDEYFLIYKNDIRDLPSNLYGCIRKGIICIPVSDQTIFKLKYYANSKYQNSTLI